MRRRTRLLLPAWAAIACVAVPEDAGDRGEAEAEGEPGAGGGRDAGGAPGESEAEAEGESENEGGIAFPDPSVDAEIAGSCALADPCGGDPVGRWRLDSACLALTGGFPVPGCPAADSVTSVRMGIEQLYEAGGRYRDTIHNQITVRVTVPASCAGGGCDDLLPDDFACQPSGGGCLCERVEDFRNIVFGRWSAAGARLTTDPDGDGDTLTVDFCVDADMLVEHAPGAEEGSENRLRYRRAQ